MKFNKHERGWHEHLEPTGKNVLNVRIVFNQEYTGIDAFAVNYIIRIDNKPHEIIKFDGGIKERVNVHTYYTVKPEKKYLDWSLSLKTVDKCRSRIWEKWRLYQSAFFEKRPWLREG